MANIKNYIMENPLYEAPANYAVIRAFPGKTTEVVGYYNSLQEAEVGASTLQSQTETSWFYEAVPAN